MITNMTDDQLNARLDFLEAEIARTKDWKSLPALNAIYQKVMDELVRRDEERRPRWLHNPAN
jgi:hypothetical protein